VICAVEIANLKVLQKENLVEKCKKKGRYFKKKLESRKEIKVLGLMAGLENWIEWSRGS